MTATEDVMKRFAWIVPILFVLVSGSASADTILLLYPNDGTGSNFQFLQTNSKGQFIKGVWGGVSYDFFNTAGYAPGSAFGGTTTLFVNSGFIKSYDLTPIATGTLSLSTFTFPTNDKNFTVPVTLAFSDLMTIGNTGHNILMHGRAKGTMSFYFLNGLYYSSNGFNQNHVPEVDTLVLTGSGLAGILFFARKRLNI
jgi:hypothetical protein